MKSRSIKIYPNKNQRKILEEWLNHSRLIYNTALNELVSNNKKSNKYSFRNDLVIQKNTKQTDPKILDSFKTPKDIRAKALFEACSAYDLSLKNKNILNKKYKVIEKSIKSNNEKIEKLKEKLKVYKTKYKDNKLLKLETEIKNKLKELDNTFLEEELRNIPQYIKKQSKFKFRKSKDYFSHMFIPKTAVKVKDKSISIYKTYKVGKIPIKEDLKNISHDFQIRKNNRLNSWSIIVFEKVACKKENFKDYKTVILDPGIRTFLTGLDSDGNLIEIGKDWSLNDKIKSRMRKLDNSKSNNTLKNKKGAERFNALKLNRELHRRKLLNMINELHKKASKQLLEYDIIVLPKLRTKSILKKENGLGNKINRKISMISHCKFHDYLKWKANTLGKIVIDQSEHYTTQTCFKCGSLNNIKESKTYSCKWCDNVCDRDVQSCFNILTRYMSSYSSRSKEI